MGLRLGYVVLLIVSRAIADDLSACTNICEKKFVGTDQEKDACVHGCESRVTNNPFGFLKCNKACGTDYKNETEEEKKACIFACDLPITSRIVRAIILSVLLFQTKLQMSVEMSGDKPRVRVQKEEGFGMARIIGMDESSDSTEEDFDIPGNRLSSMLLRPSDVNFGMSENAKSSGDASTGTISVQSDFEQALKLMNAIRDNIRKSFIEKMKQDMRSESQHSVFASRPSGHNNVAFQGPQVGNFGPDGKPIIVDITEFMSGNPSDRQNIFSLMVARAENSRRAGMVRWMFVFASFLALVLALLVMAFVRSKRHSDVYRRMRAHGSAIPEPLPVKKIDENWEDRQPTDGMPPPAYDQLSIHSLKKNSAKAETMP